MTNPISPALKVRHVKKSVSLPEDLVQRALVRAKTDPRYRTLSGYMQNLIDRDLKEGGDSEVGK